MYVVQTRDDCDCVGAHTVQRVHLAPPVVDFRCSVSCAGPAPLCFRVALSVTKRLPGALHRRVRRLSQTCHRGLSRPLHRPSTGVRGTAVDLVRPGHRGTVRRDPAAALAFDPGTGTGGLAAVPARRRPGGGTDISPRAVDRARDHARRLGLDGRIAVAPGLYPGGGRGGRRRGRACRSRRLRPAVAARPAGRRSGTGGVRRGQRDVGRVPGGSGAAPAAGRRGSADLVRAGRAPRSAHPRGAAPAHRNRRSAGCGPYRCTAWEQEFAGWVRPPVRGPRRGNHLPLAPHHRPTGRTTAPSWARMSPCLPCC